MKVVLLLAGCLLSIALAREEHYAYEDYANKKFFSVVPASKTQDYSYVVSCKGHRRIITSAKYDVYEMIDLKTKRLIASDSLNIVKPQRTAKVEVNIPSLSKETARLFLVFKDICKQNDAHVFTDIITEANEFKRLALDDGASKNKENVLYDNSNGIKQFVPMKRFKAKISCDKNTNLVITKDAKVELLLVDSNFNLPIIATASIPSGKSSAEVDFYYYYHSDSKNDWNYVAVTAYFTDVCRKGDKQHFLDSTRDSYDLTPIYSF